MSRRLAAEMILVLSLSWAAGTVSAQAVQFGVKGGVPLTNSFRYGSQSAGLPSESFGSNNTYFSVARRYTIGPEIEVHLPLRLSVEFDALYRRLNYEHTIFTRTPSSGSRTNANHYALNRWEFPLLLKYNIANPDRGLYLSAGPVLNYISGYETRIDIFGQGLFGPPFSSTSTSNAKPEELTRHSTGEIVVCGGWEFRLWILRVAPELRYTRWVNSNFMEPLFQPLLRSYQNQLDFLLSLTF